MLYNVVWVSATLQHESAFSIHIYHFPPTHPVPYLGESFLIVNRVTGLLGQEACSCWGELGGIFAASDGEQLGSLSRLSSGEVTPRQTAFPDNRNR